MDVLDAVLDNVDLTLDADIDVGLTTDLIDVNA